MKKYYLMLLLLSGFIVQAQYQYRHLNHFRFLKEDAALYDSEVDYHTAIRPLNQWSLDSLQAAQKSGDTLIYILPARSWFKRKLFNEHLLEFRDKDYHITIDPVVNLSLGLESEADQYIYYSSRGAKIEGMLGENFSFYSAFLENQARFPGYVNGFIENYSVVPGQGFAREFGGGARDFALAAGEISYTPNKLFSFSLGQGRNFFGEGYRSMILSDVAYNYPFFRIQTSFWKIKYVNVWARLTDLQDAGGSTDAIFMKKYMATHYLSLNVTPRWNLSLFESVVLGDTAQQRGLDVSFFNPVILYRPIEFAVGSGVGNMLLGLGSSYKLMDGMQAYGQLTLDEFTAKEFIGGEGYWANKFGLQLGLKHYVPRGDHHFFYRLEYNQARPYTYSHFDRISNYGHYNQPLAHPWGANFREMLAHTVWQYDRWEVQLRLHYGRLGLDTLGSNWGGDIFETYESRERDYGNNTGQGVSADLFYAMLKASWLVNPQSGLKVEAGVQYRNLQAPEASRPLPGGKSQMLFLGLRTEFFNNYYDF